MQEPIWLQERRKQAKEIFATLPIPTRGEGWIRTNFARDKIETLPLSATAAPWQKQFTLPLTQAIVMSLTEALEKFPKKVEPFLGKTVKNPEDKFVAQNEAFWTDGIFVCIPKDTVTLEPIFLTQEYNQEETTFFPRLLVVVESGAKATVVYQARSHNQQKTNFVNTVAEIFVQSRAQLTWVDIQTLGPKTLEVASKRFSLDQDATLHPILFLKGGQKGKWDLEINLNGKGAHAETLGLMKVAGRQHLELNSLTHHMAPETTANILLKTSANDESKAIFQGMIRIEKAAQKTDSYMANHNLLLSEKAHVDTIPRLEIEADDVKASHGATISHLDDEQMFYLQTRGLNRSDAEILLVEGFYEDVIGRVKAAPVQELLRSL